MQPSVLLLLAGVASATNIPDAYKYVGVGYRLLGGNPDGNAAGGGRDPGILSTRSILKLTYNNQNTFNFKTHANALETETKSVVYGTKSYKKELEVDVKAESKY